MDPWLKSSAGDLQSETGSLAGIAHLLVPKKSRVPDLLAQRSSFSPQMNDLSSQPLFHCRPEPRSLLYRPGREERGRGRDPDQGTTLERGPCGGGNSAVWSRGPSLPPRADARGVPPPPSLSGRAGELEPRGDPGLGSRVPVGAGGSPEVPGLAPLPARVGLRPFLHLVRLDSRTEGHEAPTFANTPWLTYVPPLT